MFVKTFIFLVFCLTILACDSEDSESLSKLRASQTNNSLSKDSNKPSPSSDQKTTKEKPNRPSVKPSGPSDFFNCCLFPLDQDPRASFDDGSFRAFGWTRSSGHHSASDLWGLTGQPVYAVEDGVVIFDHYPFYCETNALEVSHPGPGFIGRYSELDPKTISLKKGDLVKKGQVLGKMGYMPCVYHGAQMLHFEFYWNYENTGNLNDSSSSTGRRHDLFDPTSILKNWQSNKPKKT
jgi:murein DD-endopeptidase MepM/ murein hydrolase activator NlpD